MKSPQNSREKTPREKSPRFITPRPVSPAVSALTEELHQRSDQKTPPTIYAGDANEREITRQFVRGGPGSSQSDVFGSDERVGEVGIGVGEVSVLSCFFLQKGEKGFCIF